MNFNSKLMRMLKDNGWYVSSQSGSLLLWNEHSESDDNSVIIIQNKIDNDCVLLGAIYNAIADPGYSDSIRGCCVDLINNINKQNGYLANKYHVC